MPVERSGNLSYWSVKKAVVGVVVDTGWIRLCQVIFHTDGSVFVAFPDFKVADGILTVVRLLPDGNTARTIDFLREGKVTSHLVKYSHRPDGGVHFSQDRKVFTRIRRDARFRLGDQIGRILELRANRPREGFLVSKKAMRGKPHLMFGFSGDRPAALSLVFHWRRKSDVNEWNSGAPLGPKARIVHRVSNETSPAFFVGQPFELPFQDHVLVITCNETAAFRGIESPAIILRGGADSDAVSRPGLPSPPSEFLAAMYPVGNRAELAEIIGTIDFQDNPAV
ncbi:MAG: hypothetical protein IT185_10285 [Acidobacteria bacterium]|nr:hypothetical protein [Acidobacteriota bacterium]